MTNQTHCSNGRRRMFGSMLAAALFCGSSVCVPAKSLAQSVGLPAPRLLTTMPMGGAQGSQFELTISGDNIEDADQLAFSDARITATRKLDAAGEPIGGKYQVAIGPDCPAGLYEARVMTRLGLSSSRAFSVGLLPEVVRTTPNTTVTTAMPLAINSICNAVMTPRSVDHYGFEGRKGQRFIIDCAARGIDSKLDAVLIVADAQGRDLQVERLSGLLDFTLPDDGRYVIKVHELTFQGGPAYFYRLAFYELPPGAQVIRLPSTKTVSSFSWPPAGLPDQAAAVEIEPNNDRAKAQKISLPCDIAGSFFPAADVDVYEFPAKKGDVWWVEVASERLGLPTDPAIVVQHVSGAGDGEKLADVAEFSDIPSPVKVSSNGYAYDGPPYDAGSADILAKLVIQKDGIHRLQLSDLFGGTRSDPRNIYRLVIRKAAPDFALVAWALHMELRNGDRNALSKPLALRGGATMALEVVAVRQDGFEGEIELSMDGLPEGVAAQGLKIPAGKSRGIMLITASETAPRAIASAKLLGRAKIGQAVVERPGRVASMAWPIADSWGEIPYPRLLADVPVSVSGFELAPITLAAAGKEVCEATAGSKLVVPLLLTRRSEFSGTTAKLKVFGEGFERTPPFDVPLTAGTSPVILDLAALKTPPGEYWIAFYGSAVAKYCAHPEAVVAAEAAHRNADKELSALDLEVGKLAGEASATGADGKAADPPAESLATRRKAAAAALAAAAEQLKKAIDVAKPKDIVDIVVSEPIAIRVKPAEKK